MKRYQMKELSPNFSMSTFHPKNLGTLHIGSFNYKFTIFDTKVFCIYSQVLNLTSQKEVHL